MVTRRGCLLLVAVAALCVLKCRADDPTASPVVEMELLPTNDIINFEDAPTVSPVPTVVNSQVPTVTEDTEAPTSAPSVTEVVPTSEAPTTGAPVAALTGAPTRAPKTTAPTRATRLTQAPTAKITAAPTTNAPSLSPTHVLFTSTTEGITMDLTGVQEPLDDLAIADFQQQTNQFVQDFYNENLGAVDGSSPTTTQTQVFDVTCTIVVDQDAPLGVRRRQLRTDSHKRNLQSILGITFQQTISYRTTNPDTTLDDVLEQPFLFTARRITYIEQYLKKGSSGAFAKVTSVSNLQLPVPEDPEDNDGIDMAIIIGAAAGGGVLLLIILFVVYRKCCRTPSHHKYMDAEERRGGIQNNGDSNGVPPSQLQLSSYGGNDEMSTLAEPQTKLGVMTSNESLAGYGDQSVATVDYDYSKAYGGGGGASVVSSAGGTLGSGTRAGSGTRGESSLNMPALMGGTSQSIFSDDSSFEQHYANGKNRPQVKEEVIDVYAPAGKLGVVIDTPDEGPPCVFAIKESSVVADKLKVGDKLVCVDDEDVRSMTAIKVSKMISRKSANATRKLTIVRTSIVE